MVRISALTSFVVALAALGACAPADDGAMTDTADAGAGAEPVGITLSAQNNSGLSGQGSLTPQDGSVALAVHVMGAEGEFSAQVVRAACAAVDASTASASDAGTVTLGAGAMLDHTATINVPINQLADGRHALVFRRTADSQVVACADIPARSM